MRYSSGVSWLAGRGWEGASQEETVGQEAGGGNTEEGINGHHGGDSREEAVFVRITRMKIWKR